MPPQPSPPAAKVQPVDSETNPHSMRAYLRGFPLAGFLGATAWFLILAAGVLIPSEDYRKCLGWVPEVSERRNEQEKLLESVKHTITENLKKADREPKEPGSGAGTGNDGKQPAIEPKPGTEGQNAIEDTCTNCSKPTTIDHGMCPRCRVKGRENTALGRYFVLASISYLPLNIFLLTVLAAFVGGCAINKGELQHLERLVAEYDEIDDRTAEADRDRKRYHYLSEHPVHSAMRGLVVFLVIISGLLLAGGTSLIVEGSQTEQLIQYFRLAGIFSFFGYLAGSDPTMFATMIEFGSARFRQSGTAQQTAPVTADAARTAATVAAASTVTAARITADKAEDTLEALQAAEEAKKSAEEKAKAPPESPPPAGS